MPHNHQPDPTPIADIFANIFDVQDFEDWLRLNCLVDIAEPARNGRRAARRKVAAIVLPRSSLNELVRVLRLSGGYAGNRERRHS